MSDSGGADRTLERVCFDATALQENRRAAASIHEPGQLLPEASRTRHLAT
jgi:hypothetical protein